MTIMKKISDLFPDIKIGGTPSRGNPGFFGGRHPWVSIRDMCNQRVIYNTAETLTDAGVANSNCKFIEKGSLLFSFKLTVGRISFAGVDLYTNEAIAAFSPDGAAKAGIDLDYLALVLPLAAIKDTTKNSMGAPLLNKDKISNLYIAYLSLTQQCRIAARLKAQLAEVETARQAAEVQIRDANLLRARTLADCFATLDCATAALGDVILGIQAGKSFQTAETLAAPHELGVLKVSAVSWTHFQPDQAKSLTAAYQPDETHRIKKDDFIISRANTKELVGAVVLVEQDYPNRLLSDKTLRLVIDEQLAVKEFLLYALRAPEARKHIEHFATGTSDSMRNIAQGIICSTPIALPTTTIQRQIAKRLKHQLAEIDEFVTNAEKQIRAIEALPSKLLAQAFES